MDGENTQNPIPQAEQPSSSPAPSQGLDPQVVNLAQSIRQVESGGDFTAQGKSGEYGAYQFEPATWDSDAPKYGVNTPLQDSTPDQQNQVAYETLSDLKKQHPDWNVGNFASYWNANDPTAYQTQTPGVNAEGVSYDTPAYAQKVAEAYQQIKSGQPVTQGATDSTPPKQGMSTLEKILFGVGGTALAVGAGALTGGLADAPIIGASLGGLGGAAEATGAAKGAFDTVKGIFGGNAKANADEQATASEQAGQTEANATGEAEQKQADTEDEIQDETEAKQALQNTETSSQAYNEALGQTTTGRKIAQSSQGTLGVQGLAQNGINPTVENGNFATQASQAEVNTLLSDLDNKEQDLHTASGDTGDLDTVAAEAKQAIRNDKRIPSTDWAEGDAVIDERIAQYKQRMGGTTTLGRGGIGQIRSDGYKSFDKNASTAKNAAGRALGVAANKHMLDKSSSKELISGIHKEKEKLIHAKSILKHLDGKKAPEKKGAIQKLLHATGKYAGIYVGDKLGGAVGAVLGDMVGKNIIEAVDKRYGKNIFEKPAVQEALKKLKEKNPSIYKKIEKKLNQHGVQAEKGKWQMPSESEIAKKSHADRIAKKKKEFEAKKAPPPEKKSEYEPYKQPGLINFGKTATPKKKKAQKGLPVIR